MALKKYTLKYAQCEQNGRFVEQKYFFGLLKRTIYVKGRVYAAYHYVNDHGEYSARFGSTQYWCKELNCQSSQLILT